MKLSFSTAIVLSIVSLIQAQSSTVNTAQPINTAAPTASTAGKLTEAYPAEGSVPTPKPEWVELIKNANITNAPVLKSNGNNGPSTSGEDLYCDWAKSGCVGTSISDCPKGVWGLTFDDGPSTVSPTLYDFLKSTNQKATLFMIGANVIKYPEIVKRAFDEGHELAIHTWTHDYMTTLTNERIIAELKWTELAIKEITGYSPRLFRPPYGDIDNRVRDIGDALGFTSVIWDHDTEDWMLAEKTAGFQESWIDGNFTQWVAEAGTESTGGLSLEHDIQQVTVDIAIKHVPALQKAYKVVTVGQCAGIPSYKESNSTVLPSSSALPSSTIRPTSTAVPKPSATPTKNVNVAASPATTLNIPATLMSIVVLICSFRFLY